jgi:hypothetical protein
MIDQCRSQNATRACTESQFVTLLHCSAKTNAAIGALKKNGETTTARPR